MATMSQKSPLLQPAESVPWVLLADSRDGVDAPYSAASRCHSVVVVKSATLRERTSAMQISTIGIDLAKTVFQIHGVDAEGKTVIRKRLRRAEMLSFLAGLEPCLIGMEACATANYWARELARFGHSVKLMPPAYVKPYVKRGKNDTTDAEAICEAVTRPNMRFVPVKCRPASCSYASSHAGALDPAADDAGKRVSGASCRVRDRGRARHQTCARTDRERFRRGYL